MYSQDSKQQMYEFHVPLANLVLFNLPSISVPVAFKLSVFSKCFFLFYLLHTCPFTIK